jgi:hypothetical protein
MPRRWRNFRNAIVSIRLAFWEVKTWPLSEELVQALREILESEGIEVTQETIIQPRHLIRLQEDARLQEEGSSHHGGSWLIANIIGGRELEPDILKSLIKEIRDPDALDAVTFKINRLSRRLLFEALIEIDAQEHGLERMVARILIANKEKLTPKQVCTIIDTKLRGGDREAFFWAIERSSLDQKTKALLLASDSLSLPGGKPPGTEGKQSVLEDEDEKTGRSAVPKPYETQKLE